MQQKEFGGLWGGGALIFWSICGITSCTFCIIWFGIHVWDLWEEQIEEEEEKEKRRQEGGDGVSAGGAGSRGWTVRNSEEKTVRVTALQQDSDQWMFGGKAKEKQKRRAKGGKGGHCRALWRRFLGLSSPDQRDYIKSLVCEAVWMGMSSDGLVSRVSIYLIFF